MEIYSLYTSGEKTQVEIGKEYSIHPNRVAALCKRINRNYRGVRRQSLDLQRESEKRTCRLLRKQEGWPNNRIVEETGIPVSRVAEYMRGFRIPPFHIEKDGVVHRRCTHCQQWLPRNNDYFTNLNKKGQLESRCKPCLSIHVHKIQERPRSTSTLLSWVNLKPDPSGLLNEPCWVLKPQYISNGRSRALRHRGKVRIIGIILFERCYKKVIPDGMCLAHVCSWGRGKYGCVNPSHQRVSTHRDNHLDRPDREGTQRHVLNGRVVNQGLEGLDPYVETDL